MSDDRSNKSSNGTSEVSVNWEGLKRFLGWQGSVDDLKRVELDRPATAGGSKSRG